MLLDYNFDGGTPGICERISDDRLRFIPYANRSGCQWFYVCVRITGLPASGTAMLSIKWPRLWNADDCPPELDQESITRLTTYDSFAMAARNTVIQSHDMNNWVPVENVELREEDNTLEIPIKAHGAPVYIATQRPYTAQHYHKLIEDCGGQDACNIKQIGLSQAGRPLYGFFFGKKPKNPLIHIQAYQHATEFSGPLVADAMIRLLCSEDYAGMLQDVSFDFIPAVDIDALHYGMPLILHQTKEQPERLKHENPNRDWAAMHWPEVKAVIELIKSRMGDGRVYALGIDMHNGWHKAGDSGATYTISAQDEKTNPDHIRKQKDFVSFMYDNTDHQKPGTFWQHPTGGRTFSAAFTQHTGTPAHTLEFSRHIWWDRSESRFVHARPEFHERFAQQALKAMHAYFKQS